MATTLTPAQQQALQSFLTYTETKTPAPKTYNVLGVDWNPTASLDTKKLYVDRLLREGKPFEQIQAKLKELDPTNATPANFAALGMYDVLGLDWNSNADVNTKKGYVSDLLNQGKTQEEIRAKIKELDPTNATSASFATLDIPTPFFKNIQSSIDAYIDPVDSKDYTDKLALYLEKQLIDRGVTDFGQVEKQVTPAEQAKYYSKTTGQEIDPILFDDRAGTKYILTDQGIQKQFDPTTRLSAQLRSYVDPSSTGGAWGTKGGKKSPPGFGPEGMMRQIASRVRGATGVDDINDLELKTVTKPRGVTVSADDSGKFYVNTDGESRYLTDEEAKTIRSEDYVYGDGMSGTNFYAEVTLPTKGIYNKKTGQLISDNNHIDLGGWGEGPGITYASMTFDANGKPRISTYGEDTNTLAGIQPLMTLASIIPSPIQPFAVAANAANAAYNYGNFAPAIMAAAGASGILDSIAGTASNVAGPAGELASNSGIAGLAQNLGVSADLANKIGRVGAQGALSGTISAAQGKGFDEGLRSGIVSGVINEGVNTLGGMTGLDKGLGSLANPAKSFISSALTSAALGTRFNFSEAAKNAAMKFGLNNFIGKADLTPQQGTALNSFLEYLGKKA